MGDDVAYLVRRLSEEGASVDTFFRSLNPQTWNRIVYDGAPAWSIRDVLAHLLSAELGLSALVGEIARGAPGAPTDFDYDAHNAVEHARMLHLTPPEIIEQLRAARASTVAFVTGFDERALSLRGRHPALGETDLKTCIKSIYQHAKVHVRDVRRSIAL